MKKLLKIKTQNLYSNSVDNTWKTFEILGDIVIGMTNGLSLEMDEYKTKEHIHLTLHNLWIKSVYDEKRHYHDGKIPQLLSACSDYHKISETEFIGCIQNVYEIEYDGEILSFDEINSYFKNFFSDKLVIHDNYRYGTLSIFRFVSLTEHAADVNAFHMVLRDTFNEGKNMFTCLFQSFKFDSLFKDQFGNDNFSYSAKITSDKSILEFFNNRVTKLFEKLTVKY